MGILRSLKYLQSIFLIGTFLFQCSLPARAEEGIELYEQKIKAGLVYNFLKYTTWPDLTSQEKIKVCLFGADSFQGYLAPLEGRTAQQSVISIVRISEINETGDCNLVFIHHSKAEYLPSLLSFLKEKHVLTVSDMNEFARKGGMVELSMENQQVNLYVNKQAVNSAGLAIQDRMLRLAKKVFG